MMKALAVLLVTTLPVASACGDPAASEVDRADAVATEASPTDAPATEASPADAGTCRLFFTLDCRGSGCPPGKVLRSAVSTDGVLFAVEPEVWFTRNFLGDPAVRVGADGVWRMVATDCLNGACEVLATSHADTPFFSDAMTTVVPRTSNGQVPDLLAVGDAGWRVFFAMGDGIRSAFSADGVAFTMEDGLRLKKPDGVPGIADPTVAQRADGTYVMYFKVLSTTPDQGTPPYKGTPYYHQLFRATSADGLTFAPDGGMLVDHASVPSAYTDARGTVWVYFLDFSAPFPSEYESIAVTYELADGTLAVPTRVRFTEALPANHWTNNPSAVLLPSP